MLSRCWRSTRKGCVHQLSSAGLEGHPGHVALPLQAPVPQKGKIFPKLTSRLVELEAHWFGYLLPRIPSWLESLSTKQEHLGLWVWAGARVGAYISVSIW